MIMMQIKNNKTWKLQSWFWAANKPLQKKIHTIFCTIFCTICQQEKKKTTQKKRIKDQKIVKDTLNQNRIPFKST